jgi:hypothetical protein
MPVLAASGLASIVWASVYCLRCPSQPLRHSCKISSGAPRAYRIVQLRPFSVGSTALGYDRVSARWWYTI